MTELHLSLRGADPLCCPTCGNRGDRGAIRYVVDGATRAAIVSLRNGVLELAGPAASSRRGERPALECWAIRSTSAQRLCLARWELPAFVVGVAWRVAS